MYGLSESTNLINEQSANSDRIKTTTQNFTITEPFYIGILKRLIEPAASYPIPALYQACSYTRDYRAAHPSFKDITWAQLPLEWQQANFAITARKQLSAINISFNSASQTFYRQLWEQQVCQRFQEARQRYPEFFPCFELKEDSVKGLQYSIYFKPLTQYAKNLVENASLFPHYQAFEPIEQLWQEDGQSKLDKIFARFPTQTALQPPRKPWGAQCKQLFLGVVDRGLDLLHVNFMFLRKNPGI